MLGTDSYFASQQWVVPCDIPGGGLDLLPVLDHLVLFRVTLGSHHGDLQT